MTQRVIAIPPSSRTFLKKLSFRLLSLQRSLEPATCILVRSRKFLIPLMTSSIPKNFPNTSQSPNVFVSSEMTMTPSDCTVELSGNCFIASRIIGESATLMSSEPRTISELPSWFDLKL